MPTYRHRKFEEGLMEFDLDFMGADWEIQNEAVEKLLDFLVQWLISHIQKVDMLYVKQ